MPHDNKKDSSASLAPTLLLTATVHWPFAARLAIAFAVMGCRVAALCPRRHPVGSIRAIGRIYPYESPQPLVALRAAIESSAPDLIIPCDDVAAGHLHELFSQAGLPGAAADAVRAAIARSLGAPEACALARARGRLMAAAAEEGIQVPENALVATPAELSTWLAQHGFPAVLKADCTSGGQGISVVHSRDEALRLFDLMRLNQVKASPLKRRLSWSAEPRGITVQRFIQGVSANRAVACWQGEVLAGVSVEAIKTQHPTGPASVVRVIDHPQMSEAVRRLVRRLGVSGLCGMDFVLETSTGAAHLIEMNPRATPTCHLPLGEGRNLPAALYQQLTGIAPRTLPANIAHEVIALFPGELYRDPASAHLTSDYHDIPWSEPQLIRDTMDKRWVRRNLVARLLRRLRHRRRESVVRSAVANFVANELQT